MENLQNYQKKEIEALCAEFISRAEADGLCAIELINHLMGEYAPQPHASE